MNPIPPAPTDNRRVPTPRRPPDALDDRDRLALLAGAITLDRLDRFGAVLGPAIVVDLLAPSLERMVAGAVEEAAARWQVRQSRRPAA